MSDLTGLFGGPASEQAYEAFSTGSGPQEASGGLTEASEATVQEIAQTPSGIEVLFESKPKRLYKLRKPKRKDCTCAMPTYYNSPEGAKGHCVCGGLHGATTNNAWQEVPSVTTVLKVLDKPALPWWGMTVGVQGVVELFRQNVLVPGDADVWCGLVDADDDSWTPEEIVRSLTDHKLTVNHVLSRAGDRGSSVHTAFETWAETGTLPEPSLFPETEQGYVQGLRCFLEDAKLQPVHSEVMVGSVQHGYAGRFDLLAYYGGQEVCTHLTPKGQKVGELCEPGLGLFDLKTSSGIYPDTHYRQLEAYEAASVECGYQPSDFRAVIRVASDGRYEVKTSTATFDDFLAVLGVYQSNQRLKGRT